MALLLAMLAMGQLQAASYATGGSSPYRKTVLWLTWGGGTDGTADQALNDGASTSVTVNVAGGTQLNVSCNLANIVHSGGGDTQLYSYRPGDWTGDSLDDLYNIGAAGATNRLIAGIVRKSGTSTFDVNCSATLGGVPYRLKGVVMADAESINGTNEHVQATASGTWNVVEVRQNISAAAYYARKTQDTPTTQTIRFGTGNDDNTAAVSFLGFNEQAYAPVTQNVSMNFDMRGGGNTAIAIGLLVPYADFGDAPASYGDAMHLVNDLQFLPDSLPADGVQRSLNLTSYSPGGLAPPLAGFLGSRGPDTEQGSQYGASSLGDDGFPAAGSAEEDAWPQDYTLTVLQQGEQISQSVTCNGTGWVAGWVDFNRSGAFESSERSQAACSGGQANLQWNVPASLTAGSTYVRLRYSEVLAEIQSPTGIAEDGEVEDFRIEVIAPSLGISKTNNSGDGVWNVGEAGAAYQLTVRNYGLVATGNPPSVAAETVTVLDELPAGIEVAWTGTLTSNGWSCTAAGQRVACTTNQIIAAAGSAGDSSVIYLPVSVRLAAVGNPTNYASVGGGRDPHNNGIPPEPGSACADSQHCANVAVSVPLPAIQYAKAVTLASGETQVAVGDTVSYTLTVTVSNANTAAAVVLTDVLGAGLDFVSVTSAGVFTRDVTAAPTLLFTLPAGTVPGTYPLTYTATVNNQARGSVTNAVTSADAACSGACTTSTPVEASSVTYAKSANTAGPVSVGDVIAYTLSLTVSNSQTTDVVTLTDTLGTGLELVSVTNAGGFSCNASNPLVCTLPAGTAPSATAYTMTYEARVTAAASGTVNNAMVGTGGDNPACASTCSTSTPVQASSVTYAKSANTVGPVSVGDVIAYTLSLTVSNSQTTDVVTLTDTLGTGLDLVSVTNAGGFSCNASNPLVCTLPAGTAPSATAYTMTYEARVNAAASGTVTNAVLGTGGDNPVCAPTCTTSTPVQASSVTYAKSASTVGPVSVGGVIAYTLSLTVSNSQTTDVVTLTDTLGTGLELVSVTNTGGFNCNASNPLVCTLPAGTAPSATAYTMTYEARVTAAASGTVNNAVLGTGGDNPVCAPTCTTSTPVQASSVTYAKSASTAGPVSVGDVIAFTLSLTVSNSQTTDVVTLTDTLGTGLELVSVTNAGGFSCNASNPLVCTLPAGTAPSATAYTMTYEARVTAAASGTVTNAVLGTGGDNPVCASTCATSTPVQASSVTYAKSASTAGPVSVGDVIAYTLSLTVSNSQTTDVVTLTDTLGAGLELVSVTNTGGFSCNASNPLVCTLPAGTAPSATAYTMTYEARVTAAASGTVTNAVVGTGGDNPVCASTCSTSTPVQASSVTYAKSANTAGPVSVGDVIAYTLSLTVSGSQTTDMLTLTDTLGAGLDLVSVTNAGGFSCNASNPLVCTLPAGTAPSATAYTMTYEARVTAAARVAVTNAVVGAGGDNPGCTTSCATTTPMAQPRVTVQKLSDPGTGAQLRVEQTVRYTLAVAISASALSEELVLVDTPDPGLTLGIVPAGCIFDGTTLTCRLAAGTAAGTHEFSYDAVVNADAGVAVSNRVVASGGGVVPECSTCSTTHQVNLPDIRLSKSASAREVRIGDLVRYTLTVENVGSTHLVNGSVVDTPAAGFSYVEGSLLAADTDGMATVSGNRPLRFAGVDVRAGETATLVYTMRVSAGVRPGTHVNQAQVRTPTDEPVSNTATAEVQLAADPLLDDSLLLGTVFNDRDSDGWQDSAVLSGVKVQGGFAPAVYIDHSTQLERGAGPQPQPEAGVSLLHGIAVGAISGRQSVADPVEDHQLVIRQRLRDLDFTDDFVLTSNQGITLRMDAAGNTRVERDGDAAKGLTAAAPSIERRVAQGEGGYVVDYIIRNAGIDERGIPGVRIASVEGLLIETDQYGRYHLAGVAGGSWERGRNFILKVDPSTLPAGTAFTTDNPLLRRITPGVPVRFDFGAKVQEQVIEGGSKQVVLELGEVFFAPHSAEVPLRYLPVIEAMAVRLREYQGGEVVINANGDTQALAFERAEAIHVALLAKLDVATAKGLLVSARGNVDDPGLLLVGVDQGGALLGSVLFDTDKALILPEFESLLDQLGAALEKRGGGVVSIVGHTDVRGSHDYNSALGVRRAKAVYEAIAKRLSAEVRTRIRVQVAEDPAAASGVRK